MKGLPPESALHRKLRGPMAGWDMTALLLRRIEHDLRGLQWQNSGGKGQKPKPIDLPKDPHQAAPAPQRSSAGAGVAQRLRNLGLLAAGDDKHPPPAAGGPLTV